nr:MAG TPA: hypothetical protein [Caudoviricetes sp.]
MPPLLYAGAGWTETALDRCSVVQPTIRSADRQVGAKGQLRERRE